MISFGYRLKLFPFFKRKRHCRLHVSIVSYASCGLFIYTCVCSLVLCCLNKILYIWLEFCGGSRERWTIMINVSALSVHNQKSDVFERYVEESIPPPLLFWIKNIYMQLHLHITIMNNNDSSYMALDLIHTKQLKHKVLILTQLLMNTNAC